jgi:hypothetical protein
VIDGDDAMTDEEIRKLSGGLSQELAAMREESAAMRLEDTAAHLETRRHFEVAMEGIRNEVRLLLESVAQLSETLDRGAADIRAEMRRGFEETWALLKQNIERLEDSNR